MLSIAFFIAVLRVVMLNTILPSAMESNSAQDIRLQLQEAKTRKTRSKIEKNI
jgi:hypothetical protein